MKRKNNEKTSLVIAIVLIFSLFGESTCVSFAENKVDEHQLVQEEVNDADKLPVEDGEQEEKFNNENQEETMLDEEILSMDELQYSKKLVDAINGTWLKTEGNLTNLREIGKCAPDSYNILQGACSDGEKYVYCSFNNASGDRVKIVKFEIEYDPDHPEGATFKYVSSSAVLTGIAHGNDLTYVKNPCKDGKDKILVNTATTGGRSGTYIGVFDVSSMKEAGGKSFYYWKNLSECDPNCYPEDTTVSEDKRRTLTSLVGEHHGYSTIEYNAERGLVVATNKDVRHIMILRPIWSNGTLSDLRLQKYIVPNRANATSQGIICDENFIYTAWSSKKNVLSDNTLQIFDWEGRHVGDRVVTHDYEIESLFCMKTGGKENYFATFHYSYIYKYKVPQIKKGWKKINKKVKWKKIRVKGKWVWKYKNKKVWKYVTETVYTDKSATYRDAYCMSLGELTIDAE